MHAASDAAQESKMAALRDVLANSAAEESVAMLKGLLKQQRMVADQLAPNPDDRRPGQTSCR